MDINHCHFRLTARFIFCSPHEQQRENEKNDQLRLVRMTVDTFKEFCVPCARNQKTTFDGHIAVLAIQLALHPLINWQCTYDGCFALWRSPLHLVVSSGNMSESKWQFNGFLCDFSPSDKFTLRSLCQRLFSFSSSSFQSILNFSNFLFFVLFVLFRSFIRMLVPIGILGV